MLFMLPAYLISSLCSSDSQQQIESKLCILSQTPLSLTFIVLHNHMLVSKMYWWMA